MEIKINHRLQQNSPDDGVKFSFPIFDNSSFDFEFDCSTTPTSPNSPADHLFFNGRLLPHTFPSCQPKNNITNSVSSSSTSFSRSTSRTSSVSSKDSFMSSRSNSTNSSARTSTSTESERKLLTRPPAKFPTMKAPVLLTRGHYGSSRRWQFIAPAPALALKHQGSSSRTRKVVHKTGTEGDQVKSKSTKKRKKKSTSRRGIRWFGWNLLRCFVSACKEWHSVQGLPLD